MNEVIPEDRKKTLAAIKRSTLAQRMATTEKKFAFFINYKNYFFSISSIVIRMVVSQRTWGNKFQISNMDKNCLKFSRIILSRIKRI